MERLRIPETQVSGLSLLLGEGEIAVSAKNGSKVTLLETSDASSWNRRVIDSSYTDGTVPVLGVLGGRVLFASRRYVPFAVDVDGGRVRHLRSPFLKKAVVSGRPVELEGEHLIPAYGIPYGCRMVSPVVFSSADGERFSFRSFVSLSEDFGMELRHLTLARLGGELWAVVGSSFPYHLVFVSKSSDGGRSWSTPRLTGITGVAPVVLEDGDRLLMACHDVRGDTVKLYESRDGLNWSIVSICKLGREIRHLDGQRSGELMLGVTYADGGAELVLLRGA